MCEVPPKRGGTSHIAPPDMNSYIEKYEFIYPETYVFIHLYEFISPGDLSFHARWYIKKLATDGGEVDGDSDDCERNFGPGSNPHPDTIYFANFYVTAILAISPYYVSGNSFFVVSRLLASC